MAKLNDKNRKQLADTSFALPAERKYPINDESHARNALARASGKPEEAKVKAAVYRKWPSLNPDKKEASICKAIARVEAALKKDGLDKKKVS